MHLHTAYMEYSGCLSTRMKPLAERTCFFLPGGWGNATLVITHAGSEMSCYNPLQLPMYDNHAEGRIYITCTFVNSFSGVVHKQQKYDYNNMLFGLDLTTVMGGDHGSRH